MIICYLSFYTCFEFMFVIVFLEYGETKSTESAEAEENVSVLLSE